MDLYTQAKNLMKIRLESHGLPLYVGKRDTSYDRAYPGDTQIRQWFAMPVTYAMELSKEHELEKLGGNGPHIVETNYILLIPGDVDIKISDKVCFSPNNTFIQEPQPNSYLQPEYTVKWVHPHSKGGVTISNKIGVLR